MILSSTLRIYIYCTWEVELRNCVCSFSELTHTHMFKLCESSESMHHHYNTHTSSFEWRVTENFVFLLIFSPFGLVSFISLVCFSVRLVCDITIFVFSHPYLCWGEEPLNVLLPQLSISFKSHTHTHFIFYSNRIFCLIWYKMFISSCFSVHLCVGLRLFIMIRSLQSCLSSTTCENRKIFFGIFFFIIFFSLFCVSFISNRNSSTNYFNPERKMTQKKSLVVSRKKKTSLEPKWTDENL